MGSHGADLDGSGSGSAELRLLSPKEWRVARKARLAALHDSPGYFLPTSPHESSWRARRWRSSCRNGRWAVALVEGVTAGLARLTHEDDGPHLSSVWTRPGYRRRGIASELVRLLMGEAEGDEVFVWVIRPNDPAILLYESLKFERTGEVQVLKKTGRAEERLRFGPN